jgi:hypothetical protein
MLNSLGISVLVVNHLVKTNRILLLIRRELCIGMNHEELATETMILRTIRMHV